ncbi:MAG: SUMF1/EgtB/PvdO family nonheme iron enzyme [Paludibacteraceae bacterium]|nr:SUMF1/EgtB/PvdO family nonheme iron enzyme [Paludibacteraceae bacterium]
MKLLKLLPILVLVCCMVGCNPPAGELVGAVKDSQFQEAHPYGMVFIRKGSFLMGPNSQSAVFSQDDNNIMATVHAFWMDESEITNNEYRQFVNWVRDSIAYRYLIEEMGEDSEYALQSEYEVDEDVMPRINWKSKIPWEDRFVPDDPTAEALSPMFYAEGRGALRTTRLHYDYSWMNIDEVKKNANRFDITTGTYPEGATVRVDTFWVENGAILSKTIERPLREPKDAVTNTIISVYPDTMVWSRDFQFSYNDPLLHGYFWMPGYAEYPVVGVTWEQANAFCHWRTSFLKDVGGLMTNAYRLPTEAEWEYAARGGRKMAMYPWGDKYARDAEGCFLANFKPYRGSYYDDMGVSTMAVKQFYPNDFGLYDMAGNVAEWTASAYSAIANVSVHDMNPSYSYNARKDDPDILKRKVVKGGSWKDVSYYLQCGVRTYEYQYESRSYIGFRCVRSYIGN